MAAEPQPSPAPPVRVARAVGRSLALAFGDDGSISPRTRRAILAAALGAGAAMLWLAWQRYATFHNRSFDLAFYARLAWGEANFDSWEPIVDAHVHGLHFVWALELLGWVGAVFGQVRTLLVVQSLAVALAAVPLARIGARALAPEADGARSGGAMASLGAWAGALAWLLHPNVWHVATNDFHPGTLATLPLAWGCEALHRRSAHALAWSALGVLACREDLGLTVIALALAFALATRAVPASRRVGLAVAGGAAAYVLLFLGYFHPRFAPTRGSFALHFERWGEGPGSAAHAILTRPLEVAAWLAEPGRAPYLLIVTAPVAFACFLAPEWLVLALPILGVNLLSSFPTTLFLDSHYLTPAVPVLVAGALVGAARGARMLRGVAPRPLFAIPLIAVAALAHLAAGGSPLGARHDALAFVRDDRADALDRVLREVPEDATIQAPERVLAHVAERRVLRRGPPPEAETELVLLDGWIRRLERHREELLRTEEEPTLRDWLAREDHVLIAADGDYYLLRRGGPREAHIGRRAVRGTADPTTGRALTACLALLEARLGETAPDGSTPLVLTLVARGPCPSDLALRIGWGHRPRRVDLIADGMLSPASFRSGEVIESTHFMGSSEMSDLREHGLRVGAIRQSGARPEPGDVVALDVPIEP